MKGCARVGEELEGTAESVAVSPDGRSVYVSTISRDVGGALSILARDRGTGALRRLRGRAGCIADKIEGCAHGRGMAYFLRSVSVSPDGRGVYVSSFADGAVAIFTRTRRTGALSQLRARAGCASADSDQGCEPGRGLAGAESVTVSRDGRSVYVASSVSEAVTVFARERRSAPSGGPPI